MDMKLIGITKSWAGRPKVLDGINLDINEGNFIAITGESGAGKTTLLSLINGILQPTEGNVYFRGKAFGKMSFLERDALRREHLSIILQDPVVFRNLNVRDNILLPFQKYDNWKLAKAAYEGYSSIFKLKGKELMNPSTLSGGEIQKMAILRAVLKKSDILIADEPTGDLDTDTTARIISIFKDLNKKGRTIIMTTHHPDMAKAARDVFVLVNGKLKKD